MVNAPSDASFHDWAPILSVTSVTARLAPAHYGLPIEHGSPA